MTLWLELNSKCLSYRNSWCIIANPLLNTHCVVRSLSLALFLGSGCWHLLSVAIRNVDEHTRTLLTAVGTADTTPVNKTVRQKNWIHAQKVFWYWADSGFHFFTWLAHKAGHRCRSPASGAGWCHLSSGSSNRGHQASSLPTEIKDRL